MRVRTEQCSEHFWEGTLLRVCVCTAFTVYAVLFSVNCALLHTFRGALSNEVISLRRALSGDWEVSTYG